MLLLFSGIYRVWARIPVVGYDKLSLKIDCHMFCVHIYNKLNSLCIYSTYTVQEHHLIIIYCSLFCERVAFIFDIMVFLAHQYFGETMATAIKKNYDGPTG